MLCNPVASWLVVGAASVSIFIGPYATVLSPVKGCNVLAEVLSKRLESSHTVQPGWGRGVGGGGGTCVPWTVD